jgi:hypothetical protein
MNSGFNVTEFVTIAEVQPSEDLYGHRIKHVADHLLKGVACSSDRVAFAALREVNGSGVSQIKGTRSMLSKF